jgi:RND family efflux transporter MFP subunit
MSMIRTLATALILSTISFEASAQTLPPLEPVMITEWKSVYGRIEARDRVPARARIGGTLVRLSVTEGDAVAAGQDLAQIVDEKLDFQLRAIDGQLQSLESQLANAKTELERGQELLARGVTTAQRLDALRTQVDVLTNQIASTTAERRLVEQQATEGTILAPAAGRVLDVSVTEGAVILPGEPVAVIGGGGFFLRLAIPERHATRLSEGDRIEIEAGEATEGRLARIYPQIENGRVIADVEVEGLPDAFVDARVLVRLPVDQRSALMVPETAVRSLSGLDFVTIEQDGAQIERTVVLGTRRDGMIEVLTGLEAGDRVVASRE